MKISKSKLHEEFKRNTGITTTTTNSCAELFPPSTYRLACYDNMRPESVLSSPFLHYRCLSFLRLTEALSTTLQRPCPHIQPRGQLTCSGLLPPSSSPECMCLHKQLLGSALFNDFLVAAAFFYFS